MTVSILWGGERRLSSGVAGGGEALDGPSAGRSSCREAVDCTEGRIMGQGNVAY